MKNLVSIALLIMVFLSACAQKTVLEAPISSLAPVAAARAPWEEAWEKTLGAARKEGRVVIISALGGELTTPLRDAFKEKYDVVAEFTSGRGAEMAQKIITPKKAGLFLIDVYMGGATSGVNTLKPAGVFEPLEPALILPDVVDPKMWLNGKLRFVDKERTIFPYFSLALPPLVVNSNLVKPDEIKSHRDLLSPRWKGKILMQDPTTPGTATTWFAVVSKIDGLDFMRDLAKQEPMILRDERLQLEWVATGKYPVGIAASSNNVGTFIRAGAPVKLLAIEGTFTTGGPYNIALLNQAPHSNAARLFLNWFLGREAQTILSKVSLIPSARVDVPAEHVQPETIARPEYVPADSEEFLLDLPNHMEVAREIFRNLMR